MEPRLKGMSKAQIIEGLKEYTDVLGSKILDLEAGEVNFKDTAHFIHISCSLLSHFSLMMHERIIEDQEKALQNISNKGE